MDRGDIYRVTLDPTKGYEEAGMRPVIIVSPRAFNRLGTPLICPITQGGNFARNRGFAVPLTGTGLRTQGVVLCHQLRVLDFEARHAVFVEKAPQEIIDEVLARLRPLVE
jgi:mRNA-degrading endonuclease toxin of MazEF toxin-antitoxin module